MKIILALAAAAAVCATQTGAQAPRSDICNVTVPNGIVGGTSERDDHSYGNPYLSVGPVAGLWPNGTVIFQPGGGGFVTADGALGMKFGWQRGVRGRLKVTGRRIDTAESTIAPHQGLTATSRSIRGEPFILFWR